ncbi:MAG: hypothetical protein QOE41_1796 [Mycobacterium sp.]|jgi:hypothetical protein|nr:hypothetical protein [Mycobacterium sp.]
MDWAFAGTAAQPHLLAPLQGDGRPSQVADGPSRLSTMRGVEPR